MEHIQLPGYLKSYLMIQTCVSLNLLYQVRRGNLGSGSCRGHEISQTKFSKMAADSDIARYRQLLDELAADLTRHEVDELVFLLRFHIEGKRKRTAIQGNPRKFLAELENQGYIGVNNLTFLVQLFELFGHSDVVKKVKEKLTYCPSHGHSISHFMKILWLFGKSLNFDDVKSFLSTGKLGPIRKKKIKTVFHLYEKCFERKYFIKDDFDKLQEFAGLINRSETLELIKRQNPPPLPSPLPPEATQEETHTSEDMQCAEFVLQRTTSLSTRRDTPGWHAEVGAENLVDYYQQQYADTESRQGLETILYQRQSSFYPAGISVPPLAAIQKSKKTGNSSLPLISEAPGSNTWPKKKKPLTMPNLEYFQWEKEQSRGTEQKEAGQKQASDYFKRVPEQKFTDRQNARSPICDDQLLNLQGSRSSKVLGTCNTFLTMKKQEVCIPNNPRSGRIITLTVEEMRRYIGEKIAVGAFGNVYKAKKLKKVVQEFAIKEIKFTDELSWKSYEKEIHSGRIVNPFINPIIARAENPPSNSEAGVFFLMYPYMKNGDLRRNINIENSRKSLCPKGGKSNSQIWTRCIYQIVQAVWYLHKPVKSVRGPIFHRDLTSRNILLDENFNVKIGDFGIAVEAKLDASRATLTRTQGTDGYHPPVMSSTYNASYDTFSVGVVMLEILTGEEAKLKEDPYRQPEDPTYLYAKYTTDRGYTNLIDDLDNRAIDIKNAAWCNTDYRNRLAKIALDAVTLDETKRKEVNLVQELEEMRLSAKECYQRPENTDRCISCCINPTAKLTLMGKECAGNLTQPPCQPYCVHCLMNHHINPLMCPEHGNIRPPFGDHVYGVFVAGNNVDGMQEFSCGGDHFSNIKAVAQTFVDDVEKIVKVLTAKYPYVLGASTEHLKIIKAMKPGTEEKLETHIKDAFENINSSINEALKESKLNPDKDRLPNSLFIFYFSGHCCASKGLYLGNVKETLKASTEWIKEMLHTKLGVDHVLVFLDCCHADSQNFAVNQGFIPKTKQLHGEEAMRLTHGREKVCILQLSSCDMHEKSSARFQGQGHSHGSYFTHYLCLGLQGLDTAGPGDDTIICCEECEKRRQNKEDMDMRLPCVKYHYQCISDQSVTFASLQDFIQGHFGLLKGDTSSPVNSMPIHSCQGEKKVYLTYYNPSKSHISIHIKGSKASHGSYWCSNPESVEKLKEDIIKYTVEMKLHSDVLVFHRKYGQYSSRLIAIYPRYGKEKEQELTSLDSICMAFSHGCELEARVRENVKGLSNGPVKLSKIVKSMVTGSVTSYRTDHLKINQDCIQISITSIADAENEMKEMKQRSSQFHGNFVKLIQEVLLTLRVLQPIDLKWRGNVLKFSLHDDFCVLETL